MQNTIYEFWLMILQNIQKVDGGGIQKIAMLTDFIESQRQKCAVYFPAEKDDLVVFVNSSAAEDESFVRDNLNKILGSDDDDDDKHDNNDSVAGQQKEKEEDLPIAFNFFVIKNVGLKQKNGYSMRKLRLHYGSNRLDCVRRHEVYHYWFPDWPDHRSPQDIDVLLDMSLDLLDGNCKMDFATDDDDASGGVGGGGSATDKNNARSPLPVLHCSAGIGRTGCLAAILNGLGQIRANSISASAEGTSVDVLGIVCNLRLQRGGMVQNSEQYELIHRSLCLYQQKLSRESMNFC